MSTGIDVSWIECVGSDVPADDRWLSPEEVRILRGLHVPKRRHDWRLGRWTAKQAVAAYLHLPNNPPSLFHLEVRAADSGAPEVFLSHRRAALSISIAHSNGSAVCAVTRGGVALGCDLELIEARSEAFVSDYFVEEERALVAAAAPADQPWLATLLWSAKESALKALQEGLRLDTRSVVVRLDLGSTGGEWHPLRVTAGADHTFAGWWQHDQKFVRTLVGSPAPNAPLPLGSSASCCKMQPVSAG